MFESSLANREGGDESLRDSKKPEIEFAEEVTKRPLLAGPQFSHVRRKNCGGEAPNQLMRLLTNTWTQHVLLLYLVQAKPKKMHLWLPWNPQEKPSILRIHPIWILDAANKFWPQKSFWARSVLCTAFLTPSSERHFLSKTKLSHFDASRCG